MSFAVVNRWRQIEHQDQESRVTRSPINVGALHNTVHTYGENDVHVVLKLKRARHFGLKTGRLIQYYEYYVQ